MTFPVRRIWSCTGVPDERCVNILVVPLFANLCRRTVEDAHVFRADAELAKREEQMIVRGGREGHGNATSSQVLRVYNACTFANHQAFGKAVALQESKITRCCAQD